MPAMAAGETRSACGAPIGFVNAGVSEESAGYDDGTHTMRWDDKRQDYVFTREP